VPEAGGTIGNAPILCAVDDSKESRAALSTAATLAERLDVELVLVHAESDGADAAQLHEFLAGLVVESGLGTSVERIVLPGEPAPAIVAEATGCGVEMIVIGSRGRGALASAALGSVSSAVAAQAPCAVTIVRGGKPDRA
jgi:nucleotide-binding universal stress UspA family protein